MRLFLLFLLSIWCPLVFSQDTSKVDPPFLKYLHHSWVNNKMDSLSLKQKIGQLFIIPAYSNHKKNQKKIDDLIDSYGIGGLIFMQGSPKAQVEMTNEFQKRSSIPLLISMDAEWGVAMRLDSVLAFPYQMMLGAIENDELIYEMGKSIAEQCKTIGVHQNYAPVVDINNNPKNPVINFRSFGSDKLSVSKKGMAYMRGLQEGGVIATAKHFPGHGDTDTDSHYDLPVLQLNKKRIDTLELHPFKKLIQSGVSSVMSAHIFLPAIEKKKNLPATLSKKIIKKLLKEKLEFEGLVITDALNMQGVKKHIKKESIEVKALEAGVDLLLFSSNVGEAIDKIMKAIKKRKISIEEIDEKCRKILAVKYWLELDKIKDIDTTDLYQNLNQKKYELLIRKITEQAITVVENKNNILPIKNLSKQKILSISINATKPTPFQKMLSHYALVTHRQIDGRIKKEELSSIEKEMKNYNLIIVSIHQNKKRPFLTLEMPEGGEEFLKKMISSKKTITTFFANPYILKKIPFLKDSDALVISYDNQTLTQQITAQILFGAIPAKGKLPIDLSPLYQLHQGIELTQNFRLKYTLPEEVGLNSSQLNQAISSIVTQGMEAKAYPGAQILIAKDQKVIFYKAYGYHTYDKIQATKKDDMYDIASITKVVSGVLGLMKFYEQKKIHLDDNIGKYIPELKKNAKGKLIWKDVLTHQAGLYPWIPFWEKTKNKKGNFKKRVFKKDSSRIFSKKITPQLYLHKNYRKKIYQSIKRSVLNKEKKYLYSGLIFYFLPELIERISQENYVHFLEKEFYNKLGAYTLHYNPLDIFPKNKIVPTEKDTVFRNILLHGIVHDEGAGMMGGISGNAGLFSNANDIAKIFQMLLNKGSYGGEYFFAKETVETFTACHFCEQNNNRRGLGFDKPDIEYDEEKSSTAKDASLETFGHSGFTGTIVWADPKYNLLFIFLSNRVYPSRENKKIYELNIRPRIHQVIYDLMKKIPSNSLAY